MVALALPRIQVPAVAVLGGRGGGGGRGAGTAAAAIAVAAAAKVAIIEEEGFKRSVRGPQHHSELVTTAKN